MEPGKPVGGDAEDFEEIASTTAEFHPHRLAIVLFAIVLTVWALVMTSALRGAALGANATGTVLVVFPPMGPDHEAYEAIVEAGGGVLEKSFFVNAWIAQSSEAGFVGRLLDGGAWRVFDPAPIQPLMVVGCFTVVSPVGDTN